MNSVLLIANNEEAKAEALTALCRERQIAPANTFMLTPEAENWKIEEIRQILPRFSRSCTTNTAYVFEKFDNVSESIQNTLLKTLEEAQEKLLLVLVVSNEGGVLPTILSRVQKISAAAPLLPLTAEESAEMAAFLAKATKASVPSGFVKFAPSKKHDESLLFIDKLLRYISNNLTENPQTELARISKELLRAKRLIQQNNLDPEGTIDFSFI